LRRSLHIRAALSALLLSGCVGEGRGRRDVVPRPVGNPAVDKHAPHKHKIALELVLRIPGGAQNGELGFRFGPPRDLDGDGVVDITAGARFTALEFPDMGSVAAWSSDDGGELAYWEGHCVKALFGHAVLGGPDADGDGVADVVAAAPNGKYYGVYRGILYARSVVTGRLLWSVTGEPDERLGWDMALAGDQNSDGVEDLFVGAPCGAGVGAAYLLSGRNGNTLRTFRSGEPRDRFAWCVSAVPDLDGDSLRDLLVGALGARSDDQKKVGAVYAFSSASGTRLRVWYGRYTDGLFGERVAGLPDLDGDGAGEVAVAAPYRPVISGPPPTHAGEVFVFSGATGSELHHWVGTQPGELYGRMVASAGDLDGDGVADVAIGAPWSSGSCSGTESDVGNGMQKCGRFEVRSGKSGELLAGVEGDRPEMWLGWHIEAAQNLGEERSQRGLLVSALRSEENGQVGAGALHLYVVRE